jgi:hypothetical protein
MLHGGTNVVTSSFHPWQTRRSSNGTSSRSVAAMVPGVRKWRSACRVDTKAEARPVRARKACCRRPIAATGRAFMRLSCCAAHFACIGALASPAQWNAAMQHIGAKKDVEVSFLVQGLRPC